MGPISRLKLNLNLHICVLVGFARAIHFLAILMELQLTVECLIIFKLALPVAFVEQADSVFEMEGEGTQALVKKRNAFAVMVLMT